MRVLFTCVLLILGLGYLFALLNVYFTYAGRAGGNPLMLSYEDIVAAYSGSWQRIGSGECVGRADVYNAAARRTGKHSQLGS